MRAVRLVCDTNVYISAALNPDSALYKVIKDSAAHNLATYFTSQEILLELQDKLENKFGFPREEVVTWISSLEQVVSIVKPTMKIDVIKRDPDDNKILECAMEAEADLVISADKDLTSLKQYRDIKIIHPSSVKYVFPQLKDLQF